MLSLFSSVLIDFSFRAHFEPSVLIAFTSCAHQRAHQRG